jgi:UDP-glucose 4-epimerase
MSHRCVLLPGATGYLGSHTWLALLAQGWRVVGVDDFPNSSPKVLDRLGALAGTTLEFERADVADQPAMQRLFAMHRPQAVVHYTLPARRGGYRRRGPAGPP